MGEFGSFFVQEAAPGFGAFAGVAVGVEGDSVEDSVVSVAYRRRTPAPRGRGLTRSAGLSIGGCRDDTKQKRACG